MTTTDSTQQERAIHAFVLVIESTPMNESGWRALRHGLRLSRADLVVAGSRSDASAPQQLNVFDIERAASRPVSILALSPRTPQSGRSTYSLRLRTHVRRFRGMEGVSMARGRATCRYPPIRWGTP